MKGTIIEKVDIPDSQKALIPVPVKGTIIRLAHFLFCLYSFNPRIHKGYDKVHQKRKNKLSALIPIPTKGTMPRTL